VTDAGPEPDTTDRRTHGNSAQPSPSDRRQTHAPAPSSSDRRRRRATRHPIFTPERTSGEGPSNSRQDRRTLDLPVPRGRSARPGHRPTCWCPHVATRVRRERSCPCAALWPATCRGDRRSSARLPWVLDDSCRPRGMSPGNTRITRSNPAMARAPGIGAHHPSPPGMPSYRICGTATTRSRRAAHARSGPRRVRRPWPSDQ
jgi:hypothetical protein